MAIFCYPCESRGTPSCFFYWHDWSLLSYFNSSVRKLHPLLHCFGFLERQQKSAGFWVDACKFKVWFYLQADMLKEWKLILWGSDIHCTFLFISVLEWFSKTFCIVAVPSLTWRSEGQHVLSLACNVVGKGEDTPLCWCYPNGSRIYSWYSQEKYFRYQTKTSSSVLIEHISSISVKK